MSKMRNRKRSKFKANKKGEIIQCHVCTTKSTLQDKNGNVEKETKQLQDVIDSLEKTIKKLAEGYGSNNLKTSAKILRINVNLT